jgi:hypothetical protein
MRKTMTALAAVLAVVAAGAAPAMACGSEVYGPCAEGQYVRHIFAFEHLPDPSGPRSDVGPRYYYVNQGPTFTGPGAYAPLPTYQERAVNGWYGYEHGYYYGYNGGPYGDATSHYYDGMPGVPGPVVYRYRHSLRYGRRPHMQRYAGPRGVDRR